jgi:AraC-like ligand binding domain
MTLPATGPPGPEYMPDETDLRFTGGTLVKENRCRHAGVLMHQHVHPYAHVSVIVRGSVRLYRNGERWGTLTAPACILIEANVAHQFEILADDTIFLCVHDEGGS